MERTEPYRYNRLSETSKTYIIEEAFRINNFFKKASVTMLAVPLAAAYLGGVGSVSAAEDNTFDYTCDANAPLVGDIEVEMEVEVHGDAPDAVEPGEEFNIENSYTKVTILDTSLMKVAMDELKGEVTTFNLSSNNVDETINVAADGLEIPATALEGDQVTFKVPEEGLTAGPFEAGEEGTIEISAGQIDNTLNSNLGDIEAVCHPDEGQNTVVNTIEIEEDGNGEEDTTAPEISLNGDAEMTLEVGEDYDEPGATAEDDVDGDVSDDIEIDGEVDTDEPGEYEITYTVVDEAGNEATATRTVIVEKKEEEDTTPPEITLNGDEEMTLEEGEEYEEPGATAEDDVDGDVSDDIEIEGEVNTDKPGEYEITYTVVDEAGNKGTATRTVIVKEKEGTDEEKALDAVNKAETVEELWDALENEELELNLNNFKDFNTYRKTKLAEFVFDKRPEEGFETGYAESGDDDFEGSAQKALNNGNFELFIPMKSEEKAFNAVNEADSMDDMQKALENEDLGLDLDAYSDLYAYEQAEVANMVLENRPDDDEGYPLPDDMQDALDNAVKQLAEGVWFSGEGEPDADLGRNNDLYLDEESFDIYKKEADEWNEIGNIKGEDGEEGEKGEDGEQGEEGDKGDEGEKGDAGQDGINGAEWLVGEGEPAADKGEEGDLYLDTDSSDVYLKSGDGWDLVTNIKGEPGDDGDDGQDGENGSDGEDGSDGDDGSDGKDGSDGDDGKNGSDGDDGKDGSDGDKGNSGDSYDKNSKKDDKYTGAVTKSDNNNGSGGTLPDTATTNPLLILIGSIMALGGGALVFIRKKMMA